MSNMKIKGSRTESWGTPIFYSSWEEWVSWTTHIFRFEMKPPEIYSRSPGCEVCSRWNFQQWCWKLSINPRIYHQRKPLEDLKFLLHLSYEHTKNFISIRQFIHRLNANLITTCWDIFPMGTTEYRELILCFGIFISNKNSCKNG